jgi:GNAT superfamily N-acetyltransferase
MRLAFGTFLGVPDPASFMGDASYVRTRWEASPDAAFAAEINNELVGSNFATNWGSVGFFGPLTIRPDLWDRGLGKLLMEPVLACFDQWQTKHAGLFTFAQSQKHIGLYQRFGFYPRFLTAIMSKPVKQARKLYRHFYERDWRVGRRRRSKSRSNWAVKPSLRSTARGNRELKEIPSERSGRG